MTTNGKVADRAKTRVFLSYSRKDRAFAEALHLELERLGYKVFRDVAGIADGEDWRERLGAAVRQCDAMVFVISPKSISSSVCAWEVDTAHRHGKRVVPVVWRRANISKAPAGLSRLNAAISFEGLFPAPRRREAFETAATRISAAIDIDIAWVREQSRLEEAASRWIADGRPADQLIRLGEVLRAQTWISEKPERAPPITEAIQEFIERSGAHEESERKRLLTVSGRAFARPALEMLRRNRPDEALRIAAAGQCVTADFAGEVVPELLSCLKSAAPRSRVLVAYRCEAHILCIRLSPDGRWAAGCCDDGWVRVWHTDTGELRDEFSPFHNMRDEAIRPDSALIQWSPDGALLIVHYGRREVFTGGDVVVLNADDGEEVADATGVVEHINFVLVDAATQRAVTQSTMGPHHLWNVEDSTYVTALGGDHRELSARPLLLRPGCLLGVSEDKRVVVWDVRSAKELCASTPLPLTISLLGYSEQQNTVSAVTEDNAVHIFDATTLKRLHSRAAAPDHGSPWHYSPTAQVLLTFKATRAMAALDVSGETPTLLFKKDGKPIEQVLLSEDGSRFVMMTADSLELCDARTGERCSVLSGSFEVTQLIQFTNDLSKLLVLTANGDGLLIDAYCSNQYLEIESDAAPDGAASRRTEQAIVRMPNKDYALISLRDGSALATLAAAPDLRHVRFDPEKRSVVGFDLGEGVYCWRTDTGALAWRATRTAASNEALQTAMGDDWFAFTGAGSATIVQRLDGAIRGQIPFQSRFQSCELSSHLSGKLLVTASQCETSCEIQTIDASTGTLLWRRADLWEGSQSIEVPSIHWGRDRDRMIAVRGWNVGEEEEAFALVLDSASGQTLHRLTGHKSTVRTVVLSSTSDRMFTAAEDQTGRLWNPLTGEAIAKLAGHQKPIVEASFDPAGQRLFTYSEEWAVGLWDADSGASIAWLNVEENTTAVAMSPDGRFIAVGDMRNTVTVFQMLDGQEVARLEGRSYGRGPGIFLIAFSGDSERLAVWNFDHELDIWSLSKGSCVAHLGKCKASKVHGLGFSEDGDRLYFLSDSLHAYDVTRTKALLADALDLALALLTRGRGIRPARDLRDLLMQSAPDDLRDQFLVQSMRQDPQELETALRQRLTTGCYSPLLRVAPKRQAFDV